MCSSKGTITTATVNQAVLLVKYLMERYNVPADHVVRHWDVCTKRCPGWSGWLPPNESLWKAFKTQIGSAGTTKNTSKKKTKTKKQTVPFKVQVLIDDLNIRKGAGTNYGRTGKYTGKGTFTIIETSGDWGKLKSGAGWIYIGNKEWVKRL